MNLKGLIYCRVSSTRQVKEGNGLSSQEKRCRDYGEQTLGISIERVFNDEGVSGGVFERKSIRELFKYIDENKDSNYTVIFEDLNRLSRDIQVHNLLRNEFKKRGVELQCPNFQFEESPEGTFRENMSVSMAQYEKEKNKQRVLDRIDSRLKQGFRCFPLPIGYKYTKDVAGGKIAVFDDNYKIVKKGLEKFTKNELESINDLVRYYNKKGVKVGTIKNGKVFNSNLVIRMLRNIFYTGQLEYTKWGIEKRKAKHEALISVKTFNKIQNKINKKSNIAIKENIDLNDNRSDKSNDFPLRGFLYCEKSETMLSGAWSKGKKSKFPYYTFTRNSPLHGKSINRDKFHKEFEVFLKAIQPKEDLILAFEKAVELVSEDRKNNQDNYKAKLNKDLTEVNKKMKKYITRIGETNSSVLIESYENQIKELEQEKNEILEKMSDTLKIDGTPLKRKTKLVRNALEIWNKSNLDNKKSLLKNIFPEGIPITSNRTVGTPKYSLIYQAFELGKTSKTEMVDSPGFEPGTYRLRGGCSTS